jgi:hypothetical protein
MPANPEKYQEDIAWLLQRLPEATETQQEAFSEKVAWLVADLSYDDDKARSVAFTQLF